MALLIRIVFVAQLLIGASILASANPDHEDVIHRRRREVPDPTPVTYETFTLDYSNEERKELIQEHNSRRGSVEPSAAGMQRIVWDTELEIQAQAHASHCSWTHGSMYPVDGRFETVGQNLYGKSGWNPDNRARVVKAMEGWWNENQGYDFDTNVCTFDGGCGHYTQMAWDWTVAVGCGRNWCVNGIEGTPITIGYLVVCNYGPKGNRAGARPYTAGDSCSDCPEGYSGGCDNNLCMEDTPCHGLTCFNGGVMDTETCICDCPEGVEGARCEGPPCPALVEKAIHGDELGNHN